MRVKGCVMNKQGSPATTAEVDQLKSQGYFVRHGFFSKGQLDRVEELADRAVAYHNRALDEDFSVYRSVSVKDGIVFANEFFDDSGVSAELRRFAAQPQIAEFERSIVGADAAHHLWQIVYKFPHFPNPFPWHQDHIHTPADRPFYNIWIALSDMSVENGCLRVLPGVALDRILEYHDTPWGKSCWSFDHKNQGIPMEMKRGSIFVVTSKTLHMSGGNLTDHCRKAMLLAFVDRKATVHGKPVRCSHYENMAAEMPVLAELSHD
jgi:ectoine hydroxylase-related dioxygenase (phytanoyl-CoA dioxygenase family)